MAYADYEHCPGCDAKVIYMGDRDTMDSDELGIVVCWHQACLDAEIAQAVIAERERIIRLASQLHATIPADHPPGALASFADYLRVTSEPQPVGADTEPGEDA